MGKAKPETVARYHKEHLSKYCVMLRKDEDEELLDFISESGMRPSDIFREAMRMYMKEMQK